MTGRIERGIAAALSDDAADAARAEGAARSLDELLAGLAAA